MSASIASLRISAQCTRCGTPLIVPAWSEAINDTEWVHIWSCPLCANEFETVDRRAEPAVSEDELVQDFLPNLLVA